MIKSNIIVYSRTLTNDYRWIYDYPLQNDVKDNLLKDFERLKNNSPLSIDDNSLFVKYIKEGICFYKILKTDLKDQYSRRIFALSGFVFTNPNYTILKYILPVAIMYYYCKNDVFLSNLNNISDHLEHASLTCEIDLNHMADYFIANKYFNEKAHNILNFIHHYPSSNFILDHDNIVFDENTSQTKTENEQNPTKNFQNQEKQIEFKSNANTFFQQKNQTESKNENKILKFPDEENQIKIKSNNEFDKLPAYFEDWKKHIKKLLSNILNP